MEFNLIVRVIKMAGQGAVYIRSKFALTEEDGELYQSLLHMRYYTIYVCYYNIMELPKHLRLR